MELTKKDIMKAVLSVLATLVFCMCLCFITMQAFIRYDGGVAHIVHALICFACLFIDVVISAFYAARCMRVIMVKKRWRDTSKWPKEDRQTVAFITKERCIYNGIYEKNHKMFCAYDGMKFRQDEIVSWCYDSRRDWLYDYFIKYFSNPVRRTEW